MGIIMQTYYNDQYQNVYVCCKIVIAILKWGKYSTFDARNYICCG